MTNESYVSTLGIWAMEERKTLVNENSTNRSGVLTLVDIQVHNVWTNGRTMVSFGLLARGEMREKEVWTDGRNISELDAKGSGDKHY